MSKKRSINHHHKKDYRHSREVAIWLQQSTCYNCNMLVKNPDVHHLDHNPENNELNNLAVMHSSCHKMWHRIPIQPYIPSSLIYKWIFNRLQERSDIP